MASGTKFALRPMPPATLFATEDERVGASSPAESVPVWDFDDTTDEYMDFVGRLDGYDGGGLTLRFTWSGTGTDVTGTVNWRAAIRRIADDADDIDVSHTYDYNTATPSIPSVSGEISEDTITFTDGTDMDSLADGETFILRIGRDAPDGLTGDAELWQNVSLEET